MPAARGIARGAQTDVQDLFAWHETTSGIAAAILTDAPYLILDEPLNGLDPEGIQWVRDFIKDYVSDHRTVIVSSHYMAELELVTDHVVGLSNGRKVLDGDIAALLDQYGSLEQAYFNVVKK